MPTVSVDFVAPEIALDMLRDCLAEGGTVIQGKHFLDELKNEGLSVPDAWLVLRSGCISNPPECDIRTGQWKYTVEGYTADGIWLAIVFTFKHVDTAFLITVFSVKAKTGKL